MSSLPLFDPISLLNIHLPPRRGKLPLLRTRLLPMIFSLQRRNCNDFSDENALLSQQSVNQVQKKNNVFIRQTCQDVLWYGAGVCPSVHKACKHNKTEPFQLGLSNFVNLLLMTRGRTLLIFKVKVTHYTLL